MYVRLKVLKEKNQKNLIYLKDILNFRKRTKIKENDRKNYILNLYYNEYAYYII
jgi:hypothetical protein